MDGLLVIRRVLLELYDNGAVWQKRVGNKEKTEAWPGKSQIPRERRQKHHEGDNLETKLRRTHKLVRKREGHRRPKLKDNDPGKAYTKRPQPAPCTIACLPTHGKGKQ